jgi:cardiolipin synthase
MPARIFTVPNQLTFLRLGFLPFFVIAVWYSRYDWALGLLLAAAVSDLLDGLLARRLRQTSALGAYLDPIADKLLLSTSFLVLALQKKIAWWLTILVLSRDVIILVTSVVIVLALGARRFAPSIYGKLTTFAQVIFIFFVIATEAVNYRVLDLFESILVYAVAALTVTSGVHYSLIIARRLTHSTGERPPEAPHSAGS